MSKTPLALMPRVCKPLFQGGRGFSMLAPLAGFVAQDATPYISKWMAVGPGSFLQLTLTLATVTGTLSVILETVNDPEKDTPRFCGGFQQTNRVGSVQASMVSDRFVRVIATPGAGPGQIADWTIKGDAFVASGSGT